MTYKLNRLLWLWAGALVLALLAIIPLAAWTRATAVLFVACVAIAVWIRIGRRAKRQAGSRVLAANLTLPPADYCQPVVLVCGDGLDGLFGAVAGDSPALRKTGQGCYLRVPDLMQLPELIASVLARRPAWGGQLAVMFVSNPGEHDDRAVLAGQVRAFCHQVALVRKRGIALPMLLVSYLQASQGEGAWVSWEAGQTSPEVREAGMHASLVDWQQLAVDDVTRMARMHAGVQVSSVAAWLEEAVLPDLAARDRRHSIGPAVAIAITLVPVLPRTVSGNLWQQWLSDKLSLSVDWQVQTADAAPLPFPDPLLQLLPIRIQRTPIRRAGVIALWLFVAATAIALASSAWQNTLLARQVTDDLRRYTSMAPPAPFDQTGIVQREAALTTLRQHAERLDNHYRHGAPLKLGLGLYRGDRLRAPVLAAIASHRTPPSAPLAVKVAKAVRLDSLSLFDSGSAVLKPDSTKVLINALVDIKAQPGWLIVIAGHTDASGNDAQNLLLSRARAASVRDWMQRMGDLPDSCFAVQGFGARQPIASNDTEAGRTANRRVDIRLVPEAGACSHSPPIPG
ncbi:OmpA family protein [Pseudomonas sp. IT-P4]|uniref:OmpA family protein n=1 Tax=Pseudomonas sp. IT-P4 TaxID=3026446 RepID=UPI0039E00385